MLVTILLLLLVTSFFLHIVYLVHYALIKENRYLKIFILTGIINFSIMMSLSIIAVNEPELIHRVNIGFLFWLISGVITIILSVMKIVVFTRIFKRSKDPEFYHLNYFGKKVYNNGMVKKSEFFIVLVQMPFFLFLGAYFIGKLINGILHGFRF